MMRSTLLFRGGRRPASKVYFTTDILGCHGRPDRKNGQMDQECLDVCINTSPDGKLEMEIYQLLQNRRSCQCQRILWNTLISNLD